MREMFQQLNYILSRSEKKNGLILFAIMVVGALFEVVGVGLVPAFIGVITIPETLLENAYVRWAYDALEIGSPREMILWAAVALIVFFVVKNTYLAALAYARERYTSHRQASISDRLFRAYLRSPYTFHLQRNTSELLRNIDTEAGSIAQQVIMTVLKTVMEVMVLILIFSLLLWQDVVLTLVAFGVFGSLVSVFWRVTRAKVKEISTVEQRHRKLSIQTINQGLGGFKDARVLGREDYFVRSYAESMNYRAKAGQFRSFIQALPRLFLETVAVIGLLGISVVFVTSGRDLNAIVPTLALFGFAVIRMMPSFSLVTGNLTMLQWGRRALDVVYRDLVELDRLALRKTDQGGEALPFESEIRLDSLSYQYPGQEGEALRDVSLTIPKNASVGFVGSSGAGKTTIVDALLGLLDPTDGRIVVDGVDIRDGLSAWQQKIGYIPQHIFLTDDTVRRNVAFGREDDEIDDDAVWSALEAAQLRDLVEALPGGLDAEVGERGTRLSGGQRQRIGIARALYHRPEVLVMDEATSALDNQTERQFVEALDALHGGHTVIVIAHRLSTVRNCDTLFMLEDGRLVAEGTYDDLMETSDVFRRMAGTSGNEAAAAPPRPAVV